MPAHSLCPPYTNIPGPEKLSFHSNSTSICGKAKILHPEHNHPYHTLSLYRIHETVPMDRLPGSVSAPPPFRQSPYPQLLPPSTAPQACSSPYLRMEWQVHPYQSHRKEQTPSTDQNARKHAKPSPPPLPPHTLRC